ncbi:MAG: hypothetical protein ACQESZ_09830 [Bacteroidota bacterium]
MKHTIIEKAKEQLKPFRDKEQVYKELKSQVDKDFGSLLPSPVMKLEANSVEAIAGHIAPVLAHMQAYQPELLRQLIYRIDLNEKNLFAYLEGSDPEEHATITAWMIVERELKKVVLRMHFASGKDIRL